MWFNPIMIWILRSPFHSLVSKNIMLISVQGRKSGKLYTTPVNYRQISENGKVSLFTTSYRQRTWWRNLRGGARVSVRIRGRDLPAQAQLVDQHDEVAREMELYFHCAPEMARYFRVRLQPDGTPVFDDINLAAQNLVVIKTTLAEDSISSG